MHGKYYIKLMNSGEWWRVRAAKMTADPLCERCKAQGFTVPARCVHHIIPVESGHTEQECHDLCMRWTNLQSLCFRCHAEIHKAEGYHTRDAHRQREEERLQRWIDRHERRK